MLSPGDLAAGRYRVERLLGRGGMSSVYLASDAVTGHLWAVKELRGDCIAGGEAAARGALTELRILKGLRHPMLPAVGDVLPWDGGILLVMDYIEGRDLAEVLAEERPSTDEVLRWGIALCDVLEYLHMQDPPVIYRDLKPSNVILKVDGSLCLIDFGSAVLRGSAMAAEDSLGTVGYAAPEQFSAGGRVDERTDLYSLGMLLRRAFSAGEAAEDAGTSRPPKGVRNVLRKACRDDPAGRYQTAGEMRNALRRCLEGRAERRHRLGILLLCAVTVLMSAGGAAVRHRAVSGEAARYEELLFAAERSASYEERLADYRAAAGLTGMAGDERAYIGLIRACREDDCVFGQEEQAVAEKLIAAGRTALREEPERYGRVCLEMGKTIWTCGGEGFAGPIAAARWFEDAAAALPEGEEQALASACAGVGNLCGELSGMPAEEGEAALLFRDLKAVLEKAADDGPLPEGMKERVADLAVRAAVQYAADFRKEGIRIEELLSLLGQAKGVAPDAVTEDAMADAAERIREVFPDQEGGENDV